MKNKFSLISRLLIIFTIMFTVMFNVDAINASDYSISVKSTVTVGESFQVKINGSLIGRYNFRVTGGSASPSSSNTWFEGGTYEPAIHFKATEVGKITFEVSTPAKLTNSNLEVFNPAPKYFTVNVVAPVAPKPPTTPTTPKPPTKPTPEVPKEPEVVKSTDNTLKSLSISEGTLSPEFSADVLEYNVLLDESKTALTVTAEANDSKTTVSNAGEHKLEVGENVITVKTTPESGSEGAYKINVYVEPEPKVSVKPFGEDEDYKVIEHFVGAEIPDSFSEMKFKINDQEVVGLYSELWNTYLVYLSDKDNNRTFYIANGVDGSDNYTIGSLFQVVSIYGEDFMILDVSEEDQKRVNMTYTDVEVADLTLKGFKYDNEKLSNFSVIYVRNVKGEDNYYQYEEGNDVYQLYTDNIAMSESDFTTLIGEKDKQAKYMWFGIGALGVVSVSLAGILVTLIIKNKKTKVIN